MEGEKSDAFCPYLGPGFYDFHPFGRSSRHCEILQTDSCVLAFCCKDYYVMFPLRFDRFVDCDPPKGGRPLFTSSLGHGLIASCFLL